MIKTLPAMQETWVQSLGRDDPLEEGMATHSSLLAWRIPWTEEPGGLYSPWGSQRDTTEHVCAHTHTHTHFNVYTRFLPVQTPCSINREVLSLLIKEILYLMVELMSTLA